MSELTAHKFLVEKYANDFSIPKEIAEIVAKRYPEYSDARKYLFPDLEQLHDPALMPDIESAANVIIDTVRRGDGILIYTHDDVDGYTSAAVVYKALNDIARGDSKIYIYPIVREKDGYIVNPEVLKSYRDKGVKLLLTVDFGISNEANFHIAEQEGLKVVVCDHHETNLTHFPSVAVNPKRPDSRYPFRELAGVGVAFKLAQFLYQMALGLNASEFYNLKKEFFPIVCLGTISDRVTLRDENRVLCTIGLKILPKLAEPWIECLKRTGDVDVVRILREVLPTIGSAAYIDPRLGVDFLIKSDLNGVMDCYNTLRETDQRRRQAIDTLFSEVLSNAKVNSGVVFAVVRLSKQHYLGSVAARLREFFKRTAIIIGVGDDKCVGELRSCGMDLYALLYNFRELFLDFGGHKKAAGFSMEKRNLDAFVDDVRQYVEEHQTDIADECSPSHRDAETFLRRTDINMLRVLMPFGEGNPAPILSDGASQYTVDNGLNVIERA
jgi:single-stranded-DNA-specific exonuclease